MIPRNIEDQVRKVAVYFARELPRASHDSVPDTPEWLTAEAESWIRGHYFEFSDLVISAREDVTRQRTATRAQTAGT